ncbi:MAG: hypothetical protein FLDDKLPJ_03324 [Phycisphaerae bacterium]|nr:hypothetical protein [Phycisphaerae bacterium]
MRNFSPNSTMIPVTPSSTHEEPAQGLGKPRADRMRIVNRLSRRVTGFWSTDPDPILMVAVILIALTVYVATAAPTVTSEDSGELIAAAYCFGVPHPPGYPLWTLLCGIFLRIFPAGSVGWRANVFSGICAALAAGILFRSIRLVSIGRSTAAGAALTMAFGAVLWSQSVIAEVYTLHALLVTLLVWCVLKWRQTNRTGFLAAAAGVTGLGLSNHHLMAFTSLGVAAWILLIRPQLLLDWRTALRSTLLFMAGLLPYAYLPLRASADPPVNWGEPKSWQALADHVSRRQYRARPDADHPTPSKSLGEYRRELQVIGAYVLRELTPWALPVVLVGAGVLMVRNRSVALLWAVLTLSHVLLFLRLHGIGPDRAGIWSSKVFFVQQYIVMGLPLGAGLDALVRTTAGWFTEASPGSRRWWTSRFVRLLPGCFCLFPLVSFWKENNFRNYWYAGDHARNLLASALPNALIFPSGDHNTFPMIYLTAVEGVRTDVTIADKYGYIDPALYRDMPGFEGRKPRCLQEREQIEEWIVRHARRPVYYTVKKDSPVTNARLHPVGLLYHLLPEGKPFDPDSAWDHIHYRNLDLGGGAPRDFGADNILADHEFFRGLNALRLGRSEDARSAFARCVDYGWGVKEIANNVGSALAEAGQVSEAVSYFKIASTIDPEYTTAWWNLARIQKALGDYPGAREAFVRLAELTPADFRVHGELGFLTLLTGGDRRIARGCFEASLRLHPDQPQILKALDNSSADDSPASPEHSARGHKPPPYADCGPSPKGAPPIENGIFDQTLGFTEHRWDFGEVEPGQWCIHHFAFRRDAREPLAIADVQPSCTCLSASVVSACDTCGTGGCIQASLSVPFRPGRRLEQSLLVKTECPVQSLIRLDLTATIREEFVLQPSSVPLDGPRPVKPVHASVTIRRMHGDPFRILEVSSGCAGLSVESSPLEASGHVVDLILDPDAFPDTFHESVRIHTSVAWAEPVVIGIEGRWNPQGDAPRALTNDNRSGQPDRSQAVEIRSGITP